MARALHIILDCFSSKVFLLCVLCFFGCAQCLALHSHFAGTAIFELYYDLYQRSHPAFFFFSLMDGLWAEEGDGAGESTKLPLAATAVSP